MKKILFVILAMSCFLNSYSQSRFTVNAKAGIENSFNKYYSKTNYTKLEDAGDEYSYGMGVSFRVFNPVRLRVELDYGKMYYGQNRIGGEPTAKDVMTLTQLSFSPRIDYRVLTYKKFELYLSSGIKFLYNINSDQESYLSDGSLYTASLNYIDTSYKQAMSGWVSGAILKYNINDHLGVTLSPDYTLYFDKLYYRNSDNLQQFNLSFGVAWKL